MLFKPKCFCIYIILTLYAQNTLFGQKEPKNFWQASNSIIEQSLPTTMVSEQGPIEILSNNAVTPINLEAAITYWQSALKKDPSNANLNYKVGLSYFFSYDQQLKALPYFKQAVKNLGIDYDFTNVKESRAPYTSYFFLGRTYLENNQPDSAIRCFSLYQDNFQEVPINYGRAMSMSINARESNKNPRNVQVTPLADKINTKYAETNPVMKLDNKLLFFSSRRPSKNQVDTTGEKLFDSDIYYSVKNESGEWLDPKPFPFNTDYDEAPLFLNPNGDSLFFRKTIKNNYDIYISVLKNNVWTNPVPIKEVNSKYNETGFCLSADARSIFFSSDRKSKDERYDIYRCTKGSNGIWSNPSLLNGVINTPYNELYPHLAADGKTLFYSSDGSSKKGFGGYDIYYSELKSDGNWTDPINLGFPVCGTRADLNYYIASDDKRYYCKLTDHNSYDIYQIDGGGFDFENIASGTEIITVTNEMGVTQVMETEKKVEEEVEVAKAVDNIVEKEVEVNKMVEVEVEKEVPIAMDAEQQKAYLANEKSEIQKGTNKKDTPLKQNSSKETPMRAHEETTAETEIPVKQELTNDLYAKSREPHKILYFETNKQNLSGSTKSELSQLVNLLRKKPDLNVEIIGHSDQSGPWAFNNELSHKRANKVYSFLLSKQISPTRMHFYGRGNSTPFDTEDTEEGKAKNRRVEIILIK